MRKLLILLAASLFSTMLFAESIKIGISQQGAVNQNINRPKVGMNMEKVKVMFGAPLQINEPTGNPPISKWKYADFTVYFEGEYVIHSVLHPLELEKNSNEQP